MSQSFARIAVHLTFSTRYRRPLITDAITGELNAYLIGILRNLDCPAIRTNTAEDHAHSLFFLSRTHPLDFIVEQLKGSSSKWIKTKGPDFADFYWQAGYAAFSVGESEIKRVAAYITGQREHHRQISFKDEIRRLFREHGLPLNEDVFFN